LCKIVQNVDDYVEIYAQGDDADIERFIQGVIEGASPASNFILIENPIIFDLVLTLQVDGLLHLMLVRHLQLHLE
jgi:hypothetical protein